jgi:hypothetical protein
MKKRILYIAALALTSMVGTSQAATVTVTVADDGVSNIGSPGTFYWAVTNANASDTIAFNIPGTGPHYLQVPPSGFPLIYRKHNLTIDGYTQPGATANSNPITAANNAVLKIVIDGRSGGSRDMAYEAYDGTTFTSDPPIDNTAMATDRSGYGHDELALLGLYRSTNVTIRGLAFLGTLTPQNSGTVKGICLAHDYGLVTEVRDIFGYLDSSDAYTHISGCWFGVDPTNQTVAGVSPSGIALAAYRHRAPSGDPRPELPNIGLTIGVKAGSANPRAEFNVFVGHGYAIDAENIRSRVSGNFFGVLPDGVTAYNMTQEQPFIFAGGQFEFGRYNDTVPIIIGTDGDGVNDADEGNLFGPLAPNGVNKESQLDFYSTARKPYIIAGNRFGIGVDGTIWTNSSFYIGSFNLNSGTQLRFGSDFNGVSDDLEANIVYNNNEFSTLYPLPSADIAPSFLRVLNSTTATDGWLSVRGNQFVNNFPLYNPGDASASTYAVSWSRYITDPTDTDVAPAESVPVLSASTMTTLNGSCGYPTNSYTNLVVDVYLPDPEAQVNGALFDYPFFGGAAGVGFVNGKTHLGSFLDNGPLDSNPAVGAFSFNISGLGLAAGTKVTVAVTYSSFAQPVLATPVVSGGNVTLSWTGDNGGPYTTATAGGPSSGFGVQSAANISGPWTTAYAAGNSVVLPVSSGARFFRIAAPMSGMTTLCATPVTLQ